MTIEYPGMTVIADFVTPTVEEALTLIREGATDKIDLLVQAGLSTAEAEGLL